jgi:hypothetical protein
VCLFWAAWRWGYELALMFFGKIYEDIWGRWDDHFRLFLCCCCCCCCRCCCCCILSVLLPLDDTSCVCLSALYSVALDFKRCT